MKRAIFAGFCPVFIFLSLPSFGIDGPELASMMAGAKNAAARIHILNSLSNADMAKQDVLVVLHSMAGQPLAHGLPDEPEDGTVDAIFIFSLLTKIVAADPLSFQTLTVLIDWSYQLEVSTRRREYEVVLESVLAEGLKRPSDFRRSLIEMIRSPDPEINRDGLYLINQALLEAAVLEGPPAMPLGPLRLLGALGFLSPPDRIETPGTFSPLAAALINDELKSEVQEYARRLVPVAETHHLENEWEDLLGYAEYPDPVLAEIVRSEIRRFVASRPPDQYSTFLATPLDSLSNLDRRSPHNLQLAEELFQVVIEKAPLDFESQRFIFEMLLIYRQNATSNSTPTSIPSPETDLNQFRQKLKHMLPGHSDWEQKPALLYGRHLADEVEDVKPEDRAKALSAVIRFLKDNRDHLYARKAFVAFVDQLYHGVSSTEFIKSRKACRIVLERLGLP